MVNVTGDLLVMGKTEAESTQIVNSVLQRLDENGLTINEAKGLFNQSEVTFFGLHFTANGVSLNETKTKALNEFKVPNNASELHSFLGLVVYPSRWIKDLSTLTEPLWKLRWKMVMDTRTS
jgi:hypothetical protein